MIRCLPWALAASFVVVACAQTDDHDILTATDPSDDGQDGGTTGAVLPPSTSGDGGDVIADAGPKPGKDASTNDAGKDTGVPSPEPGDTCTAQDSITSRMCGKCGKQETICQKTDAGTLTWSEYGPCSDEVGECLPGATRPCGNCGTQTCNQYCGWAACGGQPVGHCSPGSIDFTTAGCPTGGFKSRTCGDACQWQIYSTVCESPKAIDMWTGSVASNSTFIKGNDGKIYAWGNDEKGQLGDSDAANKGKIIPTPFSGVASIAVGGGTSSGFTCVTFTDGSVKCLGSLSTSYTLGDGTTSVSTSGVTPTGFGADVVSMSLGVSHGCGLFADGSAKCWGYNTYGQLGNGLTTTSKTPVDVNLTGITQLAAGYYLTCALKGDAAYCWGYNSDGQAGDGTTTSVKAPTEIIASGVAQIAPGYYHTCAAMTDGSAKCWGQNVDGETGTGTSGTTDVKTPTTVLGIDGVGDLAGVAEICTGYDYSCARLNDGRVACWGGNGNGQLGNGSGSGSSVPKAVTGITSATKLTCGYYFACVMDGSGLPKCWGDNADGQVGNGGMPSDATTPQSATF